MLPLLLLSLFTAAAAEPPKTLRKQTDHCPSVGYFFERQNIHEHCYLCYCNDDGYAVCTIRDKERCDGSSAAPSEARSHVDTDFGERNQSRRSRRGLMDLFFDQAKKDAMVKSMSKANDEDCQPKSSKSIGCPPKDWCTGCLVCDCDENREWQCHVMSFCEDKTPRPKPDKIKKTKTNEIDIGSNGKKDKTNKIHPKKKTDKRSVKHKKYDTMSDVTTKKVSRKILKKMDPITTTTLIPSTTPMPKIAVKTVKKFIRKSDMKNGTGIPFLVIKKYISTISPINSEDLLKYRNDSRKLAQILYQQYEATTKVARGSRPVKREIKAEKILNNKQRRHFELKYNARGRKPMNTKEHNEWNVQKRNKTSQHKHVKEIANKNSFYSKQNEIFNPDETKRTENVDDENNSNKTSHRNPKVILIPRRRRNKRNIIAFTEIPSFSKDMNNVAVNISLVSDQVEILQKARVEDNQNSSDLNQYMYTVDNSVTKKYDNDITNSGIIYESTIKYVDIINIGNIGLDKENITTTDVPKYILVDEITTLKMNESQSVDLNNYTVNDMLNLNNTVELNNNKSFETTTQIDYTSTNQETETNEFINVETTTVHEQYQVFNSTYNKTDNNTELLKPVNKVNTFYIEKLVTGLKEYTLEKLRQKNRTNTFITTSIFTTPNIFTRKNNTINMTQKSKTTDLEKILQGFTKNNTKANNQTKHNQMVAIKYLKNIYSQLLSPQNNKSRLNNIAVMESICDTFGPCKISTNKIEIINSKIAELITETKRALDVIRTIRRNLQLIDGEKNCTENHTNVDAEFKTYVKKLNDVLTDTYKTPLTPTQETHVNNIKNNIKIFINSIGKFAHILNDILEIIRLERNKYDHLRKHKILIRRVNRNRFNEPLHKIKKLFLKFNVLQNTFMRNMYRAISDLELQNEENAIAVDDKGNNKKDARYQTTVNKYMNKINYNLEKLKALALKMGAKERMKRDVIDHDGAVEYLLTLMEYLLKHNTVVQSPPVTDGIDLLIDAIRRAPDIQQPKKNSHRQTVLMPTFPNINSKYSSSESEDDSSKIHSTLFNNNLNFDKPLNNETLKVKYNNDDIYTFTNTTLYTSRKSAEAPTSTTSKYVDVEDMVFNGDVISKVYMATIPTYDNIDDAYTEKQDTKTNISKSSELKNKESASYEDGMSIKANKSVKTYAHTENTTTITSTDKSIKTQFDRLNEEYEKQIKINTPTTKNLKIKNRKKAKRLRKKLKLDTKSDVSLTNEVKEGNIKKKVILDEANLLKQVTNSDDDFFQIDDDSMSRDTLIPLDSIANDGFASYFT